MSNPCCPVNLKPLFTGKPLKRMPYGSKAASREQSVGLREPYWQLNTSFSPTPPLWDYRFEYEGLPYGTNDSVQLFGASTSSNSEESQSWLRGNCQPIHQCSASDAARLYFNSPPETSLVQPWIAPPVQEICVDEFETSAKRDPVWGLLPFMPTMEGTFTMPDGGGSTSSHSDDNEYKNTAKLHLSTQHNFLSRRSFISKPIHPLSLPTRTSTKEVSVRTSEYDVMTSQMHGSGSGSSSIESTDTSEPFESENPDRGDQISSDYKCGLCDRLLSQRSLLSSRRIVRSGDLPITGVLSCQHIFHAECLSQTIPKAWRSDPPCPLCFKLEENSPERRVVSPLRNNFIRPRPFAKDRPSRHWGCAQAGDCVEGALPAPQRNSMLLLNPNRMKKDLSLKGNELPGKWSKSGSYPLQLLGERFIGRRPGGCSKMAGASSTKRWLKKA
ncbi:hypothetical protein Nepgr_033013 [Nepenthes gracilis]|uniref:RING-type domain-containing protein n=1 Tax=Nepenthes gracilis TaxID=150966 RepID=A0AAD3Y831_NEPGR|nr:hypothetical protein Nepgr_033013 [Nepenthes gracilis]